QDHRPREAGLRPQEPAPADDAGRRAGQAGGGAELGGAAEEADRAPEAPLAARPGEDAGADEHGDEPAVGHGWRGRPDLRAGAREDRTPSGDGAGHGRPPLDERRYEDARGRAGPGQRRSPSPALGAPLRARPDHPRDREARARTRARPGTESRSREARREALELGGEERAQLRRRAPGLGPHDPAE